MRKRIWASVILGIVTVTAVVFAIGSAAAGPADNGGPPGNNGTVKIDGEEFDDHPDNEPHVGCTFQVDFYGYDEGDLFADVTFQSQPPTTPAPVVILTDTVFIGEDDNSGGGSQAGLDASETYTLDMTGFTPHDIQGFHIKLTINADGSQGADVKHKVFWVTGCGPTTTTSPPTTTSEPPTTTSEPPTTTSEPPTTTSEPPTTTSEPPTTTSEPPITSSEPPPPTTTQGFQANVQGAGITGGEGVWLGLAALAILLAITFTIRMSSDRGRD